MNGSPGAGKTMLAQTLTTLLPPLSTEERIEVTKVHSLSGEAIDHIITTRPFRRPHHTASQIALVGGGAKPKPGEISLAHLGALFLDEIPEYPRSVLESLRQPLEDKKISISRAGGNVEYPADFMMIATMNPCPCGYYGDLAKECSCSTSQILHYQKRLSGPLLDRIDLTITVPKVPTNTLIDHKSYDYSQHKNAQKQISSATAAQFRRYKSSKKYNSSLSSSDMNKYASLSNDCKLLLKGATEKLQLSARAYYKTIKVARTIADLESSDVIARHHLAEALQYRTLTP